MSAGNLQARVASLEKVLAKQNDILSQSRSITCGTGNSHIALGTNATGNAEVYIGSNGSSNQLAQILLGDGDQTNASNIRWVISSRGSGESGDFRLYRAPKNTGGGYDEILRVAGPNGNVTFYKKVNFQNDIQIGGTDFIAVSTTITGTFTSGGPPLPPFNVRLSRSGRIVTMSFIDTNSFNVSGTANWFVYEYS